MSLTLRNTFGCTEAIIDAEGNLKRFYQIANILSDELEVVFIHKEDDFDSIIWDFTLHHYHLTLHYSIYHGISIYPTKTKDARKRENKAVGELAHVLEGKLMTADFNKNVV